MGPFDESEPEEPTRCEVYLEEGADCPQLLMGVPQLGTNFDGSAAYYRDGFLSTLVNIGDVARVLRGEPPCEFSPLLRLSLDLTDDRRRKGIPAAVQAGSRGGRAAIAREERAFAEAAAAAAAEEAADMEI